MVKERVDVVYNVETKGAEKGVGALRGKFNSLLKVISNPLFIGGALAAGFAKIGAASVRAAAQLEQYQISFEVMLGSAEKAKDLLAEINQVAAKTPFEQTEIIKSTQSLLAFGVAQEDVIDTFKTLGDISQGNAQKLEGLTRAYGKVQAKGKASMEEIQMVAEKGVPIIGELAKTMGVTKEEVFKLSQQGKISSDVFNAAMSSMTREGGIFYNSMEKQSQTLTGKVSTLKGNMELLAQAMGEYLLPVMKKIVDMTNFVVEGFTKGTQVIADFFAKRKEEKETAAMSDDELAEREIARNQKVAEAKAEAEAKLEAERMIEQEKINKAKAKAAKKSSDAFLSNVKAQGNEQLSIEERVAKGTLEYIKMQLLAAVNARAAKLALEGMAELPLVLVGNPSGPLKLLASASMAAGASSAINSVQLQEGGIIEPTNGGVMANIGEAGGAEAVIPLDEMDETSEGAASALGGGGASGTIILENGDELAKFVYIKNTDQLRTGELQAR